MGKFVITKRRNGEYQFNLKAKNGKVVLTSEGYSSKQNCLKGIDSAVKNSKIDMHYMLKVSSNDLYYFNLVAQNGEIIGTSQMYKTESGRTNGFNSVEENAKNAEILDLC